MPLLAAVGPLQFEVLQYRLETEYNAEIRRETAPFTAVRWLPEGTPAEVLDTLSLPTGGRFAFDLAGNAVALFPSDWALSYFREEPSQPAARSGAADEGIGPAVADLPTGLVFPVRHSRPSA